MPEEQAQSPKPTLVLVEPSAEDIAQLGMELPDWQWVEAPEDWSGSGREHPFRGPVRAVIVFARTNEENHALGLCQAIRQRPEMVGVPLLVAITMYQMLLGTEVKKMPNAHFIFKPVREHQLRARMGEAGSETEE
jgi:hypothetical protein